MAEELMAGYTAYTDPADVLAEATVAAAGPDEASVTITIDPISYVSITITYSTLP
jgi:hypothetical protein